MPRETQYSCGGALSFWSSFPLSTECLLKWKIYYGASVVRKKWWNTLSKKGEKIISPIANNFQLNTHHVIHIIWISVPKVNWASEKRKIYWFPLPWLRENCCSCFKLHFSLLSLFIFFGPSPMKKNCENFLEQPPTSPLKNVDESIHWL